MQLDASPESLMINRLCSSDGKEVVLMLFYNKERGQGMVEYALLIALLAIVVIVMIMAMGSAVSDMYSHITSAFPMH
jgi:pilus assembly protein Flp/PilA